MELQKSQEEGISFIYITTVLRGNLPQNFSGLRQ